MAEETGTLVADPENIYQQTILYEPTVHYTAGIVFGAQAIVVSAWWIVCMFIYVKNVSTDANITTLEGRNTVAIGWWWERIAEYDGTSRYLGLSLLFTFVLYAVVSVTEFVAWVMYMFGTTWFARWYFRNVGYWGSVIFYGLPPVFAFVQCIVQSTIVFPGSWAIFQLVSGLVIWLTVALIHIYYIDDLILFIDAWEQPECVCEYPIVLDAPADQEEDTIAAWEIAKAERARTCAIQCPPLPNDCKLKRRAGDTDREYTERCRAVKRGVK